MSNVIRPDGDIFNMGGIDYSLLIDFQNSTSCRGSDIFSNVSSLYTGQTFTISYTKVTDEAPGSFEIHLASNESPLLYVINSGTMIKITVLRDIDCVWYACPGHFSVETVTICDQPAPVVVDVSGAPVEPVVVAPVEPVVVAPVEPVAPVDLVVVADTLTFIFKGKTVVFNSIKSVNVSIVNGEAVFDIRD